MEKRIVGYKFYIFKEYITTFAALFGVITIPPGIITIAISLPLWYLANTTAFWIIGVISFIISIIVNLIIIEEHSLIRSIKFDPLDFDDWKKQQYEKSFDKLIK